MTIDVSEFKNKIWYEKYRPSTMKEMLLPKSIKTKITKYINDKETPCLLFHSSSYGVGKTSLAYVICEEIGADYIYVNCSLDNGIDLLRSKVEMFATTLSFTGKPKIVIMDEFGSNASKSLQDALKANIENYTESCRFIFTSNNLNKIDGGIRSRCKIIDFDYYKDDKIKDEMMKKMFLKLEKVLQLENVDCEREILYKVIQKNFPDMRKLYNLLESFAESNNNIITNDIFSFQVIDEELIDLIMTKKLTKVREYIIKSSFNYSDVYRFLFDKYVPRFDMLKVVEIIPIISEFMWRESQGVLDSEINFTHCVIKLMEKL